MLCMREERGITLGMEKVPENDYWIPQPLDTVIVTNGWHQNDGPGNCLNPLQSTHKQVEWAIYKVHGSAQKGMIRWEYNFICLTGDQRFVTTGTIRQSAFLLAMI